MTELVPFVYHGCNVRAIALDGEPWFVARDVCTVLSIGNTSQTLSYLDDDEKGVITSDTLGGDQRVSIINEPGLYSLILRSRKPEAKAFKRWITHEVLPEIRRTGSYAPVPTQRAELSRLELIEIARAAELERLALAEKVAELEPAAQAWDVLASADGDFSVREAAYVLNRDPAISTGQRRLFAVLRTLKIIGPGDIPYAGSVDHREETEHYAA